MSQTEMARTKALEQVNYIRESRRNEVAEKILTDHTSSEFNLDVAPGECSFVQYLI